MNVVGIIAEYNPFHQGHAYQIRTLKEICHADYTVIAMSGNFVQRGAPALMEKYSRAKMALRCGADLVLELPTLFATASAELFARGGVSLLDSTGIVTHLGFGAEMDDIHLLSKIATILREQPSSYRNSLQKALKCGCSFPAARTKALLDYCFESEWSTTVSSENFSTVYMESRQDLSDILSAPNNILAVESGQNLSDILSAPNNILAIEYLKSLAELSSKIIPVPILRTGSAYHDAEIGKKFCSAFAIRNLIRQNLSKEHGFNCQNTLRTALESSMPKEACEILLNYSHPFLYEDDFSTLLHYELTTEEPAQLAAWGDSSKDLAHRLLKEREQFTNWNEFCQYMKTKNITYTRLSRLFTHILLHIAKEDYQKFQLPSYLRVLGFQASAAPLLAALKRHSNLPIVTRPTNVSQILSKEQQKLFAWDLRATDLYRVALASNGDTSLKNDFRQQILRL